MKLKVLCINFIFLFATMGNFGQAANILAMFPYPFYGHIVSFLPIFEELAKRGHNVTLVSPFPQKTSTSNLNVILVPNLYPEILAVLSKDVLDWGKLRFQMIDLWKFGINAANVTLGSEQVKRFITDKELKFDLIMTETWSLYEPFVAFGHKYSAPVINVISFGFFPKAAYLSGNHLPTSYIPAITHFAFNDRMSFIERVQNSLFYYWDVIFGHLYYLKEQDAVIKEHFRYPGSENIPPLKEMLSNTALTILENDIGIGYNTPLHKNVVPFLGVNLKVADKLPDDLQKYMDDSKDGVIYLCLGSFFSIKILRPHMREAITSALRKLNHKLILKLDDKALIENVTKPNILIRSWLPQRSILAHPNCKLFITHGGLHGTMEGVYHAVPMIGVPIFGDQRYNVKFIETAGLGVGLDIFTITEGKILSAIDNVLNNPKYRENVKKQSAILRDKPMNTMDNVIYWIEYVIRHKGAPHLRPAVIDLHWYQFLMLDVIGLYISALALTIYTIKTVLKLLFRCISCLFCRKKYTNNCGKSKEE